MILKYTDRPYGGGRQTGANVYHRFPQGAQPMHTAPQESSQPIVVHDATGSYWCHQRRDSWRKLQPYKDSQSGAVQWRENGEMVAHPLAWSPAPLKR